MTPRILKSQSRLKSRTGCSRCKQRKIKCDETLPDCNQCIRKGFECPGYKRPLKWSSKYELGCTQAHTNNSNTEFQTFGRAPSANFVTSWETFSSQTTGSASNSFPQLSLTTSGRDDAPSACSSHNIIHAEEVPRGEVLLRDISPSPASRSDSAANHEFQQDQSDNESRHSNDVRPEWLDYLSVVPVPMEDDDSRIIRHYFSTVCLINSCFDSAQNFFRIEIKDLMSSYALIYHSILSMSAAHLASKKTDKSIHLLRHKTKAISALSEEIKRLGDVGEPKNGSTEHLLLATIILGMTDGWHNPSSLGTTHLHGARILLKRWLSIDEQNMIPPANHCFSRIKSFTIGIMAYWEAMASFILNQPLDTIAYMDSLNNPDYTATYQPNPWTGICTPLFIYLAKTGNLGRQRSMVQRLTLETATAGVKEFLDYGLMQRADELEKQILEYRTPNLNQMKDTGDPKTPINHLIQIAQIYRLAVLLQLYQSFPELLEVGFDGTIHYDTRNNTLSSMLAMSSSILTLIAAIPRTSGVNCLLTLPLIIAGSTLQQNAHCVPEVTPGLSSRDIVAAELLAIHNQDSVISHWRDFVRERVTAVHHYVGVAAITRGLEILEKVWAQADLKSAVNNPLMGSLSATFILWPDVMADERLETILG